MTEPLDLEPIKARLAHREVSSELVLRREESVGDDGVRRGVSSLEPVNAREHGEYVAHRDEDIAALVAEVERLRAVATWLAKERIDEHGRHDLSRSDDENVADLVNGTSGGLLP